VSRSLSTFQAVLLGGVVVLGLALGLIGLFAIGSRNWPWNEPYHLRAGFARVAGIEPGTRVRVQGVDAGEVESIEFPEQPGGPILLRLRLDRKLRGLIRSDATAQILGEGLVGGKTIEIDPGQAAAPLADDSLLASKPTPELTDVLAQVNSALRDIKDSQGTFGKLVRDPEAYAALVSLLQQSHDTMRTIQQDADAIKRLPLLRGYVEDATALLVRPDCERNRQVFAEAELFEPGRAVLTAQGKQRLDELAPWLAGLKHKGSEVVVVAYADPKGERGSHVQALTRQQSDAICNYLKDHHAVQKTGWFSSRKVTSLGMGTCPPPAPEKEPLPPARVEVVVFVPQT
jgi:phospholipid/cholesterol/gamma-HCH transport system substrate-binding protein